MERKHFIVIYTICKNERTNLTKWLNSHSGADLIVFCDSGSTDGTYEILCGLHTLEPNKFHVIQYQELPNYDMFSFSHARNQALHKAQELIPQYNVHNKPVIFCCGDMDEFIQTRLSVSAYDVLDQLGINDYAEQVYISFEANGSTDTVATKVHNNLPFEWRYPVHEDLFLYNRHHSNYTNNRVFLPNEIYYLHEQDFTSSNHRYGKHLRYANQIEPLNIHTLRYLMWEDFLDNDTSACYKHALLFIYLAYSQKDSEFYLSYNIIQQALGYLYNCSYGNEQFAGLTQLYNISRPPYNSALRYIHKLYYQALMSLNKTDEAEKVLQEYKSITYTHHWLDDPSLYERND